MGRIWKEIPGLGVLTSRGNDPASQETKSMADGLERSFIEQAYPSDEWRLARPRVIVGSVFHHSKNNVLFGLKLCKQ